MEALFKLAAPVLRQTWPSHSEMGGTNNDPLKPAQVLTSRARTVAAAGLYCCQQGLRIGQAVRHKYPFATLLPGRTRRGCWLRKHTHAPCQPALQESRLGLKVTRRSEGLEDLNVIMK